jgi:uncharacterized caspase-like protein
MSQHRTVPARHGSTELRVFRVSVLSLVLLGIPGVVGATARLALVIGNDNYSNIRKLQNARNDAKAIAARLRTFGFQVTEKLDATREEMKAAVSDFKTSVKSGDEALFFYSDEGVQISGGNFLLPTYINEPRNEDAIKYDSSQLQRVLDELAERQARFSLIIIDACRDYPFQLRTKGTDPAGLAPANPAQSPNDRLFRRN